MRTENIEVYEFTELPQEMKEKAIEDYRYSDRNTYHWESENEKTLKEFEELVGINVYGWEYDSHNYRFNLEVNDGEIEGLQGLRLYKYIQNNISDGLYKGKYYSTTGKFDKNKNFTYKSRRSKVIKEFCCNLTGYYLDMDVMEPIINYLKKPNLNLTYKELMSECIDSLFKSCSSDMAGNETDDYISTELINQEFEFTIDGSVWER